ncbi:hypothetical protein [Frankia sp. AgB32]|uniref:hypothetical protein n=1 Tax=Frankia sp. AgB32 TaxID=631119 RepID=UPI00200C417D|nr:hypothetical protein [Frankia sp. AgB32]MCK9893602.1 hypothetical protein [Frankia sp. AgB32]
MLIKDLMSPVEVMASTLSDIRVVLARNSDALGVLIDSSGEPAGLVGAKGAWPAVLVDAGRQVEAAVLDGVLLDALAGGIPALVAVRGERARTVGLVHADRLLPAVERSLLDRGAYTLHTDHKPHGDRPGERRPSRVQCHVCGTPNVFPHGFPEDPGVCQGGDHLFVAFWE